MTTDTGGTRPHAYRLYIPTLMYTYPLSFSSIFRLMMLWSLAILCGGTVTSRAAVHDDEGWTLHLAYRDASQVIGVGEKMYAVMNGNLLVYDTSDESVTTPDRLSGLSDRGISYIAYNRKHQSLVIVYSNNNIDLLHADGTVTNLPQMMNYTEESQTPRALSTQGDWAVISTTKGVVLLNLKQETVHGYYPFGRYVNSAVVTPDTTIYATTYAKVLKGRIRDNLYDQSQWHTACDFPATALVLADKGVYVVAPYASNVPSQYSGLTYMAPSSDLNATNKLTRVSSTALTGGTASYNGTAAYFWGSGTLLVADPSQPTTSPKAYAGVGTYDYVSTTSDGTYWVVTQTDSLKNYRLNEAAEGGTAATLTDTGRRAGGFGPRRDYCFELNYVGERLLVAGGKVDYSGKMYEPTAMYYDEGEWYIFPETGFTLNDNAKYRNVTSIAQDPNDPTHHFVSCTSGLLEFKDLQFVKHYNASNSPLAIAKGGGRDPNYTYVDGLNYDAAGNLWMTNFERPDIFKQLAPDGTWTSLTDPTYTDISTPDKTLFTPEGQLWVSASYTSYSSSSGLYALDDGGTPSDPDDDTSLFRNAAVNEDGVTCDIQTVYDMALDREGQLWFGCATGVYAVTDPAAWYDGNMSLYQPKVPRNDGTNYADYLLTGVPVTAVAVDGGNRKWLSTMGSGLYLVSADGTEVLEHFTASDTPLLSDIIHALAIHPTKGTLMIGTDKGLCAYETHIVPPTDGLSKSNIKVYPNPVRPEYRGQLHITGLPEGAEVKVVTTGSQLVARLTATGGSCEWNLCSQADGRRVAPGVYYLLIANAGGSKGASAKVVVI